MGARRTEARVRIGGVEADLEGILEVPRSARGVVLFAHGSGSSRFSPRNQYVARLLHDAGLATVLVDLLSPDEDLHYAWRFEITFLARRLIQITTWLKSLDAVRGLRLGYFGASTGAAAALQAAADLRSEVSAVVCRGGRPDLALDILPWVETPTRLIVGSNDEPVTGLNRRAYGVLRARKDLVVIPGANHLFEQPGALDEVARLAAEWFLRYLPAEAAA